MSTALPAASARARSEGGRPGRAGGLRALGSIDSQTRREHVHARLRDAISSGELAPGTHLAEVELSESLGVSRGTLREALRHLQQEGLVSADARGRLSVRVVTDREVGDIFAVRRALESLAVELVCAAPEHVRAATRLREALGAMRGTVGDFPAQIQADMAFHELLCALSGSETLVRSWRAVSGLTRAAITAAGPETALHNMAAERHLPLVDFVEAGDAAGGAEFLREHMHDAATRIVARMQERGGA
ncbi:GntR family transcriptional regulator [Puerhibacterium puerhi]|uniref:GntR family transcriptional regulator n=1 Tax=Puerhibacterium puerhi TaxID=2692623 RepID=UPI00191608F2|nr:GntR family transcriptional regulator [Puerhibacterium puerhi]